MTPLILDLEVENWPYMSAIASPRHPDNYVVMSGWAVGSGERCSRSFSDKALSRSKWLPSLEGIDVIVAHNAAFEMQWIMAEYMEEFIKFLARGGRVFCTAYAEYLLSNQQTLYPSLDETAPSYGGTQKIDEVKMQWAAGKRTSEIDHDLLLNYLIGDGGDIENTRKVFYGQAQQLVARGMWNMAFARMDALVFNCFAMHSGLCVDKEHAFTLKGEAEVRLKEIDDVLQRTYLAHILDYVNFNLNSDFHVSAWLFGGPIKYEIRDTWFEEDGVTPKYEKYDAYQFDDGTYISVERAAGMDTPTAGSMVAVHGPLVRYKSGKNKGTLKVFRIDSDVPKKKNYVRYFSVGAIIPLEELDREFATSWKRENKGKRTLVDGTPVYGSGKDALEPLSVRTDLVEWRRECVKLLLERAKIDKDLGTYYLREVLDDAGNVVKTSGMLQYVDDRNIINHTLNNTATVTTRLSSKDPNLQNVSRGGTSRVKEVFTSRFDNFDWLNWAVGTGEITRELYDACSVSLSKGIPNGAVVEADYSALEVVTLAALSRDKALMQALLSGTDMHCMRLSSKLGEPYESVWEKCHNEDHPEHEAYDLMRTLIKPKAFALI